MYMRVIQSMPSGYTYTQSQSTEAGGVFYCDVLKKMCLFLDQWSDLIITFGSFFLLRNHQTCVIKTCKCFTSETIKSDQKLL